MPKGHVEPRPVECRACGGEFVTDRIGKAAFYCREPLCDARRARESEVVRRALLRRRDTIADGMRGLRNAVEREVDRQRDAMADPRKVFAAAVRKLVEGDATRTGLRAVAIAALAWEARLPIVKAAALEDAA